MVGCAAEQRNRVQRVLQEANVQLGTVLSDVFGESGLNMLDALMNPNATPEQIADLAVRQARQKIPLLKKALEGHRMTDHRRKLIRHSMEHRAFLEEEIAELDKEISEPVKGHAALSQASELAQSVSGIKEIAAASINAETGADISQFPNGGKLSSWVGTCPGNNITGGKRKNAPARKGNPWETLAAGKPYLETSQADLPEGKVRRLVRHHSRRLKQLKHWLNDHKQRCAQTA